MNDSHIIFDALGRVLESAENSQVAAAEATSAMVGATRRLEQQSNALVGRVSAEVSESMSSAGAQAAKILTDQFSEATRLAGEAEEKYRNSVRWASWQLCVIVSLCGISIIGATTYFFQRTFPSAEEIQALRADKQRILKETQMEVQTLRDERERLAKNIAQLNSKGARAQLNQCMDSDGNKRMSVKIDESAGEFTDGYRIMQGY